MKKLLIIFLLALGSSYAQVGVKIVDGTSTAVVLGATGSVYESALTAIATGGGTAITATTTKVQLIYCTNNTGSATTLTIKDGGGNTYMSAATLAANSVVLIAYGTLGLTYTGGITISAGNTATVSCQVKGVQ